MSILNGVGIKLENFKSFGAEPSGIEALKRINVIIGRNNSGKSALIESIQYACEGTTVPSDKHHQQRGSLFYISQKLKEEHLRNVFRTDTHGGIIGGQNHWEGAGRHLVDSILTCKGNGNNFSFVSIDPLRISQPPGMERYFEDITNRNANPFKGSKFYKLQAERDIRAEPANATLEIKPDGSGFTTTVTEIINSVSQPSSLVEDKLLAALNEVFKPDSVFTGIKVQRLTNGAWEIFIAEANKGWVALSGSGSGLKTILLVLAYLIILPTFDRSQTAGKPIIYSFEELENNLHPALQRRLLAYIRKAAVDNDYTVFITTHSSAVIDLFSTDEEAQIIHVTHDGTTAKARTVSTYVEHHGILDDLDVRASDLLQANGIVWVEGPSDRLYFNRWVELWSDGKYQEGTHYQCMFYGGRLLAHLSSADPTVEADDVVKILKVNRNAILLMDSDKADANTTLNTTKLRLEQEINSMGGISWVTAGREVENYLPLSALQSQFTGATATPTQFQKFPDYLDSITMGEGDKFKRSKVLFAEKVCPSVTKEDLESVYDMQPRMEAVMALIGRWNGQRES